MTRKSYAKALDDRLKPLGFSRKGDDWTRIRDGMRETVNRQSSWLGGVTVNLYIVDVETEKLYLEIFGPTGAIQMTPQYERIGQLMTGRDGWWTADELDGPKEMAEAVVAYGLPWFDKVRTLEDQADKWYARAAYRDAPAGARGYNPNTLAGLALTLYRLGARDEACRALSRPPSRRAEPEWIDKIARVRTWLGCPSP